MVVSKTTKCYQKIPSFEEAFCSYLCRLAEVTDGNETKGKKT